MHEHHMLILIKLQEIGRILAKLRRPMVLNLPGHHLVNLRLVREEQKLGVIGGVHLLQQAITFFEADFKITAQGGRRQLFHITFFGEIYTRVVRGDEFFFFGNLNFLRSDQACFSLAAVFFGDLL